MSSSLHQLNLSFHPVQDRLLLRMTTAGQAGGLAEFRLWLTRRFVRLLWKALEQMLEADAAANAVLGAEGREALKLFQQSDVLTRADFETPYKQEEVVQTPLGTEPLLVTRFQVTKNAGGSQVMSLQTAEGQGINLSLNTGLIHSLRKLLADKIREAEWDLPCELYQEPLVMPAGPKSVN
jgi:hypothetical protein